MSWLFNLVLGWASAKFKDLILNNPKTTITGIVGALATQVPALAPFKEIIVTITVALIGIFSKDADKTGTVAQPRTDPGIVAAQNASVVPDVPDVDYSRVG